MSAERDSAARAPVAEGLAPERLGRWRVLHATGLRVRAARGLDLFLSEDGGRSFARAARASRNPVARALARAPLAARLLRAGMHHLLPLPGGAEVAVVRGALLFRASGERRFRVAHKVERGTRPLNVCRAPSGRLYFGEYFGNPRREAVRVFGSADGRAWEPVHAFAPGAVRHVHGIQADPARGGVWVATGDTGREAGVWWTPDDFRTLEPVARGVQRARAVALLPTPHGLIVPTDTPAERNFVQLLDPATGRLERLAPLPGSVLSACRTRALWLLSTAVEPSAVNRDRRAALFASADGLDWRPVARFERDLAWLRDERGYLQYPTLLLPAAAEGAPWVLATAQALLGLHGRLLRWSEDEVLRALGRPGVRPEASTFRNEAA